MKLNILATGMAPDHYSINGEVITAYHGSASEVYDLSTFPEDGVFQGADTVNGVPAIRNVERVNGVLNVTLCQQVGPGHWVESGWFEVGTYNPESIHVKQDASKAFAGKAWAKTSLGKVGV